MTSWDEGVEYTELFHVIQRYAEGDTFHQVKALALIADNYTPFGNLPMEDSKRVVENILEQHDYRLWWGGRPSLAGVQTVVAVANWSGDRVWGIGLLMKMLNSLIAEWNRMAHAREGTRQEWRHTMLPDGTEVVIEGLKALQDQQRQQEAFA
jgi:hypothetical protein